MRGLPLLLAGALLLTGCQPFRLVTDNRVHMAAPVKVITENRVQVESPPSNHSPKVVPMPVGPGECGVPDGPRVALIDVDGLLLNNNFTGPSSLGENPVAFFREKLDAAAADPHVCAVVLRVNSPGGSVTATDVMWRDLQAFRAKCRKPVVACLMDVGTGGAYYLATASDAILAHPTTVTGGIGVVLNLYNLQDLMAQYNIFPQEVKSGKHIDMGTSARNLPPEVKAMFEGMAGEYHDRFIRVVRQARPGVREENGTTFDGRVFTATQAQQRGLIDRTGYLDDAVALARELGQCPAAHLALYRRANDVAHSPYAVTANAPLHTNLLPNLPGLDRRRLPAFLYMWQPEVTLETAGGR